MSGTAIDVLIVVAVLGAVWRGLRTGMVRGAMTLVGLLCGGVLGVAGAAFAAPRLEVGPARALTATAFVVVGVVVGRKVGRGVGQRLDRGRWRQGRLLRMLDAGLGGLLGGVGVLVVAWLVVEVLLVAALPGAASAVASSRVLAATSDRVPEAWGEAAVAWGDHVVAEALPRVLGDPVPPPAGDGSGEESPAGSPAGGEGPADSAPTPGDTAAMLAGARPSIVKVTGVAEDCGVTVTGTGIVYAPGRVMTAAHVVGGVEDPVVVSGSRRLPATVVYADPRRDVAVLAVVGLRAKALVFESSPAESGDETVVAGYPKGGDFRTLDGTVARAQELVSAGGDGSPEVARDVYRVRAAIVSGYSGGPMLSPDGGVYGMVFASARLEPGIGYAMTAAFLSDAATAGVRSTREVSAGPCLTS